ncbi:MAG: hypothetical protein CVU57_28130 [Deltaproteobacteria bacterium HGW-Deltaproteobacteria-15]|nr:MAG: hypothetical protein CVU57_28130 [Deltaproteobacteria bacterium HGW-Deltaproteobacteria-15]
MSGKWGGAVNLQGTILMQKLVIAMLTVLFTSSLACAQIHGGMMGSGMMGGMAAPAAIPKELPTPDKEWLEDLREILALEKKSVFQYERDRDLYRTAMPYMMIIPQEYDHVERISELFSAYGVASNVKTDPVERSSTLEQAYEICLRLEADSIPRYERLVQGAKDPVTARTLDAILSQTRMHYMMFNHALGMSGMMGRGMGR